MSHYNVSTSPAGGEVLLLLEGPGIGNGGRPYVFANTERCAAFVEAVNFAYEQGMRAGLRLASECDRCVMVVAGRNPDELRLRPERWWEKLKCLALTWRRGG